MKQPVKFKHESIAVGTHLCGTEPEETRQLRRRGSNFSETVRFWQVKRRKVMMTNRAATNPLCKSVQIRTCSVWSDLIWGTGEEVGPRAPPRGSPRCSGLDQTLLTDLSRLKPKASKWVPSCIPEIGDRGSCAAERSSY